MASSRLRLGDRRLLLVVLTHNAHLLLVLSDPTFTTTGLLDGLRLGRGDSLLALSGVMTTANQLNLSLDLAQDFVHTAHRVDGGVHCAIGGDVVQVGTVRLLGGSTGCRS